MGLYIIDPDQNLELVLPDFAPIKSHIHCLRQLQKQAWRLGLKGLEWGPEHLQRALEQHTA